MLTDALVTFVPLGSALTMVGGAGVSIQVGQVLDLLGEGPGLAPVNIIGNAAIFGTDMGVGVRKALLEVNVGTAFATGNAATWNLAWQFAEDAGTPTYQPSSWVTTIETGAQPVANAPGSAVIARFDMPPQIPPGFQPRFTRLLMQFPAGTNLNAGTITFAGLVTDRDDQANKYAQKNYVVS